MASTISVYIAGLALLVNSMVITIFAFLGNIILAPIISALEKLVVGTQYVHMSDVSYLIPSIWMILICMEIVTLISFFVVLARKETPEDYYGGY